jgi:hypothetical protein
MGRGNSGGIEGLPIRRGTVPEPELVEIPVGRETVPTLEERHQGGNEMSQQTTETKTVHAVVFRHRRVRAFWWSFERARAQEFAALLGKGLVTGSGHMSIEVAVTDLDVPAELSNDDITAELDELLDDAAIDKLLKAA